MEDSIEWPVVSVSMVELCIFKVAMKTVPISERKTHGCTQKCRAVREMSRAKDGKISSWDPTVVS